MKSHAFSALRCFTAVFALLAPALRAAPVTWVTSTVAGPGDVSTVGTLVGAMNVGRNAAETVNGVAFSADAGGNGPFPLGAATVAINFTTTHSDFMVEATIGGSAPYAAALDAARFTDDTTSGTVTLGGLVAGRNYQVQLWITDSRGCCNTRTRTVKGDEAAATSTNSAGPQIATGTFTANGAAQTITITGTGGFHGPQLNLLQLRDVSLVVTNTNDSGPGSLRQAIADAAAAPGPDTILFAPALSGQTITLSSEIVISSSVTIDATSLPAGLTITDTGDMNYRLLDVRVGTTVTFRGLTLANGGGSGFYSSGSAIRNDGTLTLTHCTLSGNSGGAIYNTNTGSLTLTQCTLANNSTTTSGGAIYNNGTLTLTRCTLSGNSATFGGAIYNNGTLTLNNSIVAGNTLTVGNGPDIYQPSGTITPTGVNLIGNLAGSTLTAGPAVLTDSPLLAPLASNGGPTQTMALLPGSPAIDAATVIAGLTTDQRGFTRSRDGNAIAGALPDIGAYEAQVAPVGSLGFNFNGASPRALAATDSAGAPRFAQTHWNNLTGDYDNGQTGPLSRTLSGGGTATVRTWYDSLNLWQYGATTTPDQKLMSGYLDSNGAANTGTDLYGTPQNQPFFALADLPAALTLGGYRVVVYADTDAAEGSTGEYWLTTHSGNPANVTGTSDLSPRLFLKDSANFSGTYTRVPATSTARATAAAGNYLVFEAQTQPAFILRTEDNPSPRAVINAVQIVRNELLVVTTTADENDPNGTLGAGISLREAIALAPDGGGIVFDSALSGQTITLNATLGDIVLAKSLTVDASSLPGGLAISGNQRTRLFRVEGFAMMKMRGLTLTGGNGSGADGGALRNDGTTMLERCTLTGNSTGSGGAILNYSGIMTLSQCTLAGNSAATNGGGGAILNDSNLTLTHCTLSGNSAGVGGGIYNRSGGQSLTLTHCLIAENSAASVMGPDIYRHSGTVTATGVNFIGFTFDSSLSPGPALLTGNALLAPLGNYGGSRLLTMALRPGSPARNAAAGSTITSDQRGKPIVGVPDLGAYEAGTVNLYSSWSWENLGVANVANGDPDGDGRTNFFEYATLTDPNVQNHEAIPVSSYNKATRKFSITMKVRRNTEDLLYQIMRSTNLSDANGWTMVAIYNSTNGLLTHPDGTTSTATLDANDVLTVVDDPGNAPSMFYRVVMLTTQ